MRSPFFCMITQVTTYLKGLFRPVSFLIQFSRQLEVHWLTWVSVWMITGHTEVFGYWKNLSSLLILYAHPGWCDYDNFKIAKHRECRTGPMQIQCVQTWVPYLVLAVLLILKNHIYALLDDVAYVISDKGSLDWARYQQLLKINMKNAYLTSSAVSSIETVPPDHSRVFPRSKFPSQNNEYRRHWYRVYNWYSMLTLIDNN